MSTSTATPGGINPNPRTLEEHVRNWQRLAAFLVGGTMRLDDNGSVGVNSVEVSTGAPDAHKIVALGPAGLIDSSMLPATGGARSSDAGATASLADAASGSLTLAAMGKGGLLYQIATDFAARVRLYATAAARTADAARAIGVNPGDGQGLIAEVITTVSALVVPLSPIAAYANMDGAGAVPTNAVYALVTNLSGGAHVINVTVTLCKLEF